jgi:TonB-linked SusC/RagA family outer membrane protein
MRKKTGFIFICLLFASLVHAQTRRITGSIVSVDDNEPVIGASVVIKGTSLGTVTDIDGQFFLEVAPNQKTLVVAYLGMKTQEVEIKDNTSILRIQMESQSQELGEVLVVAFGTANKSTYTGSASQINSSAIDLRPITSVTQALSGLAAGVQVGNNTGQPGSAPSLRIRGISSINDANDPLYVVDGSPYENALSNINTDDIESITILKDASSAALYGSRAAAGVVIITTKKGRKGQPAVNVKYTQSFSKVGMDFYETIDRDDFYPLNWEKVRNQYYYSLVGSEKEIPMEIANQLASGLISSYGGSNYKSVYNLLGYNPYNVANNEIVGTDGKLNPNARFLWADDLDWVNSVRQLGLRSEATVNYSGANDNTDYFVSAAYLSERGYMINSDFSRMTGRANVNTKVNKWLKTGLNMSGNISEGVVPNTTENPYYYPLYMGPIYPLHAHDQETGEYLLDEGGNKLYDFGGGLWDQPIRPINGQHNVAAELPVYQDKYRRSLLGVKTYAEIKFTKELKFTTNYSVDLNTYYSNNYTPKMEGIASPGRLTKQTSQRKTWTFNQLLEFQKDFGVHHVDLLAGHEAFSTSFYEMSGDKSYQMSEGIVELNNFSEINGLSSYTSDYRTEGFIFRGNYVYDERYIASLSYRYDGSSKFHIDTRWSSFWSAGLSYRIDREKFMKSFTFIDQLKLRSSYGQVGNDSGIGYYAWQSLYSMYPNAGAPGFAISSLGNRDLQWETNTNFDVGIDFAFLKRISGSIEYFDKQSDNMLYSKPLNPSSGFSSIKENAFSMYNRGFELDVRGDILKNPKGWEWTLSANASHYRNKVTDMPVEPYRNDSKKIEVGHSIYEFSLHRFMGVNPDTGLSMYLPENEEAKDVFDYNGQKMTYEVNNARYEYVGSAIPKVYGGITSTLSYKNISLVINASYQLGGKIYDSNYRTLMSWDGTSYGRNMHKDILRRWQKKGDVTDVPRLDGSDAIATNQAGTYSDRWLVSSDYFELTSVNLSYNFPQSITKPLGVKKLLVYATGDLMYRYTKRQGLNVRYNFHGTVSDGYLPATTYTLGFNLTF